MIIFENIVVYQFPLYWMSDALSINGFPDMNALTYDFILANLLIFFQRRQLPCWLLRRRIC